MEEEEGQEPDKAEVLLTNATLPAIPDMFMAPSVWSGVGSAEPVAPPAHCIRKYLPAPTLVFGKLLTDHVVPDEEAY